MPLLCRHDGVQSFGTPVVDGLMDFFNGADDPGLPMQAAVCDMDTRLRYKRSMAGHVYIEWAHIHTTFVV